ncbi:hypothetical protein Tco_1112443 [Tanacetum coccineum]|uniref:Uncharacterized protein n=1 Tax=Tanacetum coccineum TaxID=301880 RepID=A0ABQ5IQT6_9ASTR
MGDEFEPFEPSGTRTISSHSSALSDSTTPLSPDHPLTQDSRTPTPTRVSFHHRTARMVVRTQPTLSPGMSARIAEATALSPSSFHKRYRYSYETPSRSSSLTLPVRKRYRGTSELIEDTKGESSELDFKREGSEDGLEDEDPGIEEEEEAAPKGQSVPEQEGAGSISAFKQPTLVTWVDPKDGRVFTNIPTYVPSAAPVQTPPSPEWSPGSLPVSPSSSVVPSPIALLVATPAATISRHGHVRLMPRGQLCGYDIQKENHDLRRQIAKERRERLELTDHVARMEKRQESGGD